MRVHNPNPVRSLTGNFVRQAGREPRRLNGMSSTYRNRMLLFFRVFRAFWLAFCLLFTATASVVFAFSLHLYLTPDHAMDAAGVGGQYVFVSLCMAVTGVLLFVLGRILFRRLQRRLDAAGNSSLP